jgi:5'-3' exonuclease
MGIQGLVPFLRKRAPDALRRASREDVTCKKVGVDLSITIYRGAAMAYKNGPFSHLETLAREVGWLRSLESVPVYVIDGVAPCEKLEEAEKREHHRKATQQKLENLLSQLEKNPTDRGILESVSKLERQCFRVTPKMREDALRLLKALGVAVAQAPGEAERSLAHMQRSGLVDVIFTEDIDVLVCGAHSFIKNSACLMYEQEGHFAEPRFAEEVTLADVLSGLEMTYESFVTMSVFSGSDFAPKLARFGPATAWKHVKRFGESVEACFQDLRPEDRALTERYRRAAELLTYASLELGPTPSETKSPSKEEIERLLQELRPFGSVAVLRAYVDRCEPNKDEGDKEEERPEKRAKLQGSPEDNSSNVLPLAVVVSAVVPPPVAS